jgi:hypothetical protein
VGHRPATPLLHRQAGLGAIQGLDWTLFPRGITRWPSPADSDTDPPHRLISPNMRIAREFKGLPAMWF